MTREQLALALEAILLTAEKSLSMGQLERFFTPDEKVNRAELKAALAFLEGACSNRSYELKETASGFRLQTRAQYQQWVQRHTEESNPRYSRALLETLALIAWRQPITRAEIEMIRGVAVSSHIIHTLQARDWITILGHKEVPGRPALWGTTRQFLDYFNLKSLDELPSLAQLKVTH